MKDTDKLLNEMKQLFELEIRDVGDATAQATRPDLYYFDPERLRDPDIQSELAADYVDLLTGRNTDWAGREQQGYPEDAASLLYPQISYFDEERPYSGEELDIIDALAVDLQCQDEYGMSCDEQEDLRQKAIDPETAPLPTEPGPETTSGEELKTGKPLRKFEESQQKQPIQEWWDKSLFETLTKKYTKR